MAQATGKAVSAPWHAEVVTEYRCIPMDELTPWGDVVTKFYNIGTTFVVISRPGFDAIRFRVNRRDDRPLTFTDTRDEETGVAGSTGVWGTWPPSKPGGRRRTLTPTAWKAEIRRFIGEAEADTFVRFLSKGKPPLF
jgi:hypothetical protein